MGRGTKPNKRRDRTDQYRQARAMQDLNDYAQDVIEYGCFKALVKSGVIMQEPLIKMRLHNG